MAPYSAYITKAFIIYCLNKHGSSISVIQSVGVVWGKAIEVSGAKCDKCLVFFKYKRCPMTFHYNKICTTKHRLSVQLKCVSMRKKLKTIFESCLQKVIKLNQSENIKIHVNNLCFAPKPSICRQKR